MAPATYRLQSVLRHLVSRGKTGATFEEILDLVVLLKNAKDEPIAASHRHLLWNGVLSEVQEGRIELEGDISHAAITITAAGSTRNIEPGTSILGHRSAAAGEDQPAQPQTKDGARNEYIQLAGMVEQIVEAFQNHEPASLLLDPQNLPHLIRDNMESIDFLKEQNQEIISRINMTSDDIDYLLGPH
ncbi:hypothetical protein C8Q78DRAFT_1078059 [Trametes maxima]|nr:hypothetical protein C8Q78DRAFT_1078059 [Trametes maxima]